MYLDWQLDRSKRQTDTIVEKTPGKEFMWLCWMPHDEHVMLAPAYLEGGNLCANLRLPQVLKCCRAPSVSPQLVKGAITWLIIWR
jgi:hypothetical protein